MPENEEHKRCSWGDGITIKPDGEHELDPCVYRDVQEIKNVTIVVSRCIRCGHTVIGWKPQLNTEVVYDELNEEGGEDNHDAV